MSYVENAGKYELYHWSLFEELQVIESIGRGRRFYLNRISNKEMNRTSSEDSYKDLCWYTGFSILRLLAIMAKAKKLLPVPIKAKINKAPATAFALGSATVV